MALSTRTKWPVVGRTGVDAVSRHALVVAFAAVALIPAYADENKAGDGKLDFKGSVFFGTAQRTTRQDSGLLPSLDSLLVGIPGNSPSPSTGRNQDDGNLNFNRGDAVSTVAKTYLTLEYKSGNYGAVASGKGWYDYALVRSGHPWGNVANGYVAGSPLSDAGANSREKFSGVVADNLYVYGHHKIGSMALDWKAGYQKLDWGLPTVMGGLRDINPIDVPARMRPGAQPEEGSIAIPAIFVRFGRPNATSFEAFYQLRFQRTALNQDGTFFAGVDYVAENSDKVMFGGISDRTALATGTFIKRAPTQDPSDSGQGGIALKHTVEPWATVFGLYATQFHSRAPYASAIKSQRVGAPIIPNDPGNLNPMYFTEFPEDIRMFGLTFETKWRGGSAFGEYSYRPNQPLQYNSLDLLGAFLSLTSPTLLRAQATAVAPGAVFHGWERHKVQQLQLGAMQQIPGVLGAKGLTLGAEVIYKGVQDLPDQTTVRFGRSDAFGTGPVAGYTPAAAISNSFDGFVTRSATGYRVRAGLLYANVFNGIDLIPSISYGQDVSGWSYDGSINEGRKLAAVSLRANAGKQWTAEMAWQPTWGGIYNNLRDRGTAQANVGFKF